MKECYLSSEKTLHFSSKLKQTVDAREAMQHIAVSTDAREAMQHIELSTDAREAMQHIELSTENFLM